MSLMTEPKLIYKEIVEELLNNKVPSLFIEPGNEYENSYYITNGSQSIWIHDVSGYAVFAIYIEVYPKEVLKMLSQHFNIKVFTLMLPN